MLEWVILTALVTEIPLLPFLKHDVKQKQLWIKAVTSRPLLQRVLMVIDLLT